MAAVKYFYESNEDKHDNGSVFDTDNLISSTLVSGISSQIHWMDLYSAEA